VAESTTAKTYSRASVSVRVPKKSAARIACAWPRREGGPDILGLLNHGDGAFGTLDHNFFLLINVGVGGTFSESPDSSLAFPQTMFIGVHPCLHDAPHAGLTVLGGTAGPQLLFATADAHQKRPLLPLTARL
jgi:hypothetical protein